MRKILLLLCVAFVVVCYGYPCIILPLGSYSYEVDDVKYTYSFSFDGKVKVSDSSSDETKTYNYKLDGDTVLIEVTGLIEYTAELDIDSFYEINVPGLTQSYSMINYWAMAITIGVGAIALLLILAPSKRR